MLSRHVKAHNSHPKCTADGCSQHSSLVVRVTESDNDEESEHPRAAFFSCETMNCAHSCGCHNRKKSGDQKVVFHRPVAKSYITQHERSAQIHPDCNEACDYAQRPTRSSTRVDALAAVAREVSDSESHHSDAGDEKEPSIAAAAAAATHSAPSAAAAAVAHFPPQSTLQIMYATAFGSAAAERKQEEEEAVVKGRVASLSLSPLSSPVQQKQRAPLMPPLLPSLVPRAEPTPATAAAAAPAEPKHAEKRKAPIAAAAAAASHAEPKHAEKRKASQSFFTTHAMEPVAKKPFEFSPYPPGLSRGAAAMFFEHQAFLMAGKPDPMPPITSLHGRIAYYEWQAQQQHRVEQKRQEEAVAATEALDRIVAATAAARAARSHKSS